MRDGSALADLGAIRRRADVSSTRPVSNRTSVKLDEDLLAGIDLSTGLEIQLQALEILEANSAGHKQKEADEFCSIPVQVSKIGSSFCNRGGA